MKRVKYLSPRKRQLSEKKEAKRQRKEQRRKERRETEHEINNLILGGKS